MTPALFAALFGAPFAALCAVPRHYPGPAARRSGI